jgi:hypothetical protein
VDGIRVWGLGLGYNTLLQIKASVLALALVALWVDVGELEGFLENGNSAVERTYKGLGCAKPVILVSIRPMGLFMV